MYIREREQPAGHGDLRLGRHFTLTEGQPLGRIYPPLVGEALTKNALRAAGVTTEQWADKRAAALIRAALEQSSKLRPFIGAKLGTIDISKDYHHYVSDREFVY